MRILRMMKKNRAVLTVVCAVMVMMLATGCGEEKKAPIPVDLSSEGRQEKEESPAADAGEDVSKDLTGTEELDCNVKSIGQDSLVVCKSTTYSDGDADMAEAPAPDYEEAEDLATVYVNENCSYRYKTVRNGGVNPEDVSEREGSFGDLKEGMTCIMTGSWRDGNFYADSIEMMEFA